MITTYFNHLYLTVNQKTYNAITQHEFLQNRFSGTKIITTDAGQNRIWTGCYLYGKSTYIEFFSQDSLDNLHNLGLGSAGIAFSVDTISEIKELYELFKKNFSEQIIFQKIPRKINNRDVSWFERLLLNYDFPKPLNLSTWIMAYYPEYLSCRDNLASIPNSVTRQVYNKINYQDKLMEDIISAEFIMDKSEHNRLSTLLKTINFHNNEMKIIIDSRENQLVKIKKLIFRLTNAESKKSFYIGDSYLELEGYLGTWEFK